MCRVCLGIVLCFISQLEYMSRHCQFYFVCWTESSWNSERQFIGAFKLFKVMNELSIWKSSEQLGFVFHLIKCWKRFENDRIAMEKRQNVFSFNAVKHGMFSHTKFIKKLDLSETWSFYWFNSHSLSQIEKRAQYTITTPQNQFQLR